MWELIICEYTNDPHLFHTGPIHTSGVPTYALGLGLSSPSDFTLSDCNITGSSPVFSYRVFITFTSAAAGSLFQSRVTSKVSLTNLVGAEACGSQGVRGALDLRAVGGYLI